jgi:arylsulfatase A-like enzyme
MEGRNLLSSHIKPVQEEVIFSQYGNSVYCIRTPKWKLIETVKPKTLELYQLINDPAEQHNISATHPGQANNLLQALSNWRSSCFQLDEIKKHDVDYSKEALEKLRTLGYIE